MVKQEDILKHIFGKERWHTGNWPDFIKSGYYRAYGNLTSTWHYVNIDPQPDFKHSKKILKHR